MHPFLVINPGSRNGKSAGIATSYEQALHRAGIRYEQSFTSNLSDAVEITRGALAAGFDPIVAVGGDGTINRVIQGFFGAGGVHARLGVLYSGTSPDFCRYQALPTEPAEAVAALLAGRERAIDIGEVSFRDREGRARTAQFASSVNIGLGAGIAARANRYRRHVGDSLGTLAATLATIAAHRECALNLEIVRNGSRETHALARLLNVTIGKNPHLAGGLKLGLEIAPDDGRLFIFSIHGLGRAALIRTLPSFYTGSAGNDRRFPVWKAEAVSITAPGEALQIEFDGDPAGFCPVEIRILPRALRLLGGRS